MKWVLRLLVLTEHSFTTYLWHLQFTLRIQGQCVSHLEEFVKSTETNRELSEICTSQVKLSAPGQDWHLNLIYNKAKIKKV